MSLEQTHKQFAPGRRPALCRGVAVMLAVLLTGLVVRAVKEQQREPVELVVAAMKSDAQGLCEVTLRLKNRSESGISYLAVNEHVLGVKLMKPDTQKPAGVNFDVCSEGLDWQMLRAGEEKEFTIWCGGINSFWQAEFEYAEGVIKPIRQQVLEGGSGSGFVRWKTVRSATVLPPKMGQFTLAGK
jgi:hypothetical protein